MPCCASLKAVVQRSKLSDADYTDDADWNIRNPCHLRYLRLKKEDVLFIGGSDEHGVPITIRAKKEGITPQDVVDRYHSLIKESFKEFGISFDVYSLSLIHI